MNAVLEFANNLATGLFWVNIPLTIFCVIIGIISWASRDSGHGQAYGSAEYANSTWRMHTAAQSAALSWLVWVTINAVPAPDYIYRDRIVEKKVNAATTYKEAFDACMNSRDRTQANIDACDVRALTMVKPNVFILKTVTRDREVPKYRADPYIALYDNCMRYYPEVQPEPNSARSIEDNIKARMSQCHDQAMSVRRYSL